MTTPAAPPRTGKPREAQGWSNARVFHPAARGLATWLARTPVTPNMVSVAGAAMVVAAGLLYAWVATPVAIVAGFALHLAWHVVDGADGDLARMTGRASPIGEVVDGCAIMAATSCSTCCWRARCSPCSAGRRGRSW